MRLQSDIGTPPPFQKPPLASDASFWRLEGNEPHHPGLRGAVVTASEAGIREIVPGALGVNVLSRPAGPWVRLSGKMGHWLLATAPAEASEDEGILWKIETGPVRGTWRVQLSGQTLKISCRVETAVALDEFCPLAIPIHKSDGWLLLFGEELPLDLAEPQQTSRLHPAGGATVAAALNSQGGWLVRTLASNLPPAGLRLARTDEHHWIAAPSWGALAPGEVHESEIEFRPVPFNGAMRLEDVVRHVDQPRAVHFPEERYERGASDEPCDRLSDDAWLELELDSHRLRVRAWNEERPVDPSQMAVLRLDTTRVSMAGVPMREVRLTLEPCIDMDALRLEAELQTECGNPTWDGPATVVIPGNMARCNYHPEQVHGGGPKWGPWPEPSEEPHARRGRPPGACEGWTFAGSRLPQVWAAAADRSKRRMAWIGTTPRSQLGENCAGFVSPADGTTRLRLATPTLYEPWIPLGYSRMRQEPRRDTARLAAGETLVWTFWIHTEETEDLNAWAACDRALYVYTRPRQPEPLKLRRDEAIAICSAAIHDHFYKPDAGILTYSTGPKGQHALAGFTGMSHSALVMQWAGRDFGREEWQRAGTHVLDTVADMFLEGPGFPFLQARSDYLPGQEGRFRAGSGEPGYVTMCAFDNLAEALRRERAAGTDHPQWEKALRRCADAWVRNQSPEGLFPHKGPDFGQDDTENLYEETNIECGVVANLVDAWELTGEQKYLEAAERGGHGYVRDLKDGRLWGGPGDIRALVNSEVPMFFLRAYRRLYEATGEKEWLGLAVESAAWRYSFQYAYSWPVERGSPLWRQGWAGLGCESASACNLHTVAFGCINVPDLYALWKATGDPVHLTRCRDLALYSAQQYARFPGDLGFSFAGAGTESFWASDSVWGKGWPHIFTEPGFELGYMAWVTGWSGYGALWARELAIEF